MLRSLVRTLGHRRWFARLGPVLVPADRLVGRLTGGRVVALGLIPSLLLTTTGRRSGRPRTIPLLGVPDGDSVVVVGSNWGGPRHPAWALNLLADPAATLTRHGLTVQIRARRLTGPERERAWRRAVREWPAYRTYAARAGRPLHVFRLEPAGPSGGPGGQAQGRVRIS
jgi:deazaflavin-dependent oxidoreductase (nitroreductase family)